MSSEKRICGGFKFYDFSGLILACLFFASLAQTVYDSYVQLEDYAVVPEDQIGHFEVQNAASCKDSLAARCNLFEGRWVHDNTSYPQYKEGQCSYMDDHFACGKYGRKDMKYQSWRWQPHQCDLPRFNGTAFLEKIRGKKLIFVGDSLNRNQWTSMLCLIESSTPALSSKPVIKKGNLFIFEAKAIEEAYKEDPGNTKYIFKHILFSVTDPQNRVKPSGVSDGWDSLCDQWNEEEEQKRFAQAKKNREKSSNIKHSCGWILIGKHRLNLEGEDENNRKVSDFEVYEKTHLQKGMTTFIDERSKNISREYRERTGYSDPAPSMDPPPFDFETWKELTGGPKKGRCYGFGSSQSGGFSYYQGSNSSVSSYAIESENRFADLTKEIEELRVENARIKEDARRREEENQRSMEETRRRTQNLESVVREMLQ